MIIFFDNYSLLDPRLINYIDDSYRGDDYQRYFARFIYFEKKLKGEDRN